MSDTSPEFTTSECDDALLQGLDNARSIEDKSLQLRAVEVAFDEYRRCTRILDPEAEQAKEQRRSAVHEMVAASISRGGDVYESDTWYDPAGRQAYFSDNDTERSNGEAWPPPGVKPDRVTHHFTSNTSDTTSYYDAAPWTGWKEVHHTYRP